jgi:hypothetical protein
MDERGKIDRPRNYLPMTCGWRDHACTPRDGQVQAFSGRERELAKGRMIMSLRRDAWGFLIQRKAPGATAQGTRALDSLAARALHNSVSVF